MPTDCFFDTKKKVLFLNTLLLKVQICPPWIMMKEVPLLRLLLATLGALVLIILSYSLNRRLLHLYLF